MKSDELEQKVKRGPAPKVTTAGVAQLMLEAIQGAVATPSTVANVLSRP